MGGRRTAAFKIVVTQQSRCATRSLLIFLAILLCSAPAIATEECKYVSAVDLGSVQFLSGKAKIAWADGSTALCDYALGDEGGSTITCPGKEPMNFSVAGSAIDHAGGDDILALLNTVWYKVCPGPSPTARQVPQAK